MAKQAYPVQTLTRTLVGEVPAHRFVGTDNALAGDGANTLGVSAHYGLDEDTGVYTLGAVPIETGGPVDEEALLQSDANGCAIEKAAGAGVARALSGATKAGQFILCQLIPN